MGPDGVIEMAAEGVVEEDEAELSCRAAIASSSGGDMKGSPCSPIWLAANCCSSANSAAAGSRARLEPDGNLSVAASNPGANAKKF